MEPDDDKTRTHVVLTKGTMVSHYRIVEKIGAGGMGEVYLAEDTKLNRVVALKFLSGFLSQDEDQRKRFAREAQAAARLGHANIVAIYEVGEHQGRPWFSMENVEGTSLEHLIELGDIPEDRIIELAMGICNGLRKAHETGIVHRDIKPSNILVDPDGCPRVLDFGLAVVRGTDKLTQNGSTLGTIGYMSPEQVEGKEVDSHSDLFSLGVVLYELLTGRNPFRRDSHAATFKAILQDDPQPITRYKSDVSDGLQHIILKLLQKRQELRYQSAADVNKDLRRLRTELEHGPPTEKRQPSIAVLPFTNLSADPEQEYFCDGLTEEIISALAYVRDLRVVSRTSSFSFRDTREDIREIGRKLNVSTILEGSIRKAGNRIRITAQLIDTESGFHLWTEKYDREMEDVFAIQDDVTASIVGALHPELLHKKATNTRLQTANMEAYNEYLLGLAFWNKRTDDGLMKSLDHFTRAVSLDPTYSMAYCGIADAYNVMAGYCVIHPRTGLQKSMEAVQKALELDPNNGEAHGSLAINLWELNQAISEAENAFGKALDLNPNSARTMNSYAEMLTALGRFGEASQLIEKVLNLDPLAWVAKSNQASLALYSGNHEIAEVLTDQMLAIEPRFLPALRHQCRVFAARGNLDMACTVAMKALEIAGEHPMSISQLGYVSGLSGDRTQALECLDRLKALEGMRFVPSYERALIHLGMGDDEKALDELEQGVEEGYCRLLNINVDPRFDVLKKTPRFEKLVRKLNLV